MQSEVIKYIFSGIASGLSMLLISFGSRALGAADGLATAAGVLFSFLVSFVLQRRWVFAAQNRLGTSAVKFVIVTTITWGLSSVLYFVMHDVFMWSFEVIQFVVLVTVAGLNFTINRLWTFRAKN